MLKIHETLLQLTTSASVVNTKIKLPYHRSCATKRISSSQASAVQHADTTLVVRRCFSCPSLHGCCNKTSIYFSEKMDKSAGIWQINEIII
jgi:hypothetical protein